VQEERWVCLSGINPFCSQGAAVGRPLFTQLSIATIVNEIKEETVFDEQQKETITSSVRKDRASSI